MVLSKSLTVIKSKLNLDHEVVNDLEKFLKELRKQDIITSTLLSRKISVRVETAENILAELVNENILNYFIIVACTNPNSNIIEDSGHYRQFNSLTEYNNFSKGEECPICGCGYKYDIKHIKVGFKINSSMVN